MVTNSKGFVTIVFGGSYVSCAMNRLFWGRDPASPQTASRFMCAGSSPLTGEQLAARPAESGNRDLRRSRVQSLGYLLQPTALRGGPGFVFPRGLQRVD